MRVASAEGGPDSQQNEHDHVTTRQDFSVVGRFELNEPCLFTISIHPTHEEYDNIAVHL